MKALVYEKYAEENDFASILKLKDIPEPNVKSNEVLFRVKAAALNYDDIWGMRGKPLAVPLPHISGTDAAGEVIAVGEDVKGFKVGDRVVSHGNMSCRVCSACTSGREFDCKKRKIWGFETGPLWGGYCEIAHLPEINVLKIPDSISYEDAAAASMTLLTSWHMLVGRAKIKPGQVVLVMGGSSGVGIFGIQIAKLYPDIPVWINDLYVPLYNFWTQLRDRGKELSERVREEKQRTLDEGDKDKVTAKAKELFNKYKEEIDTYDDFEKAVAFFIMNKCSFSGLTENSTFSQTASNSNFSLVGADKLAEFSELIKHWKITNIDYSEVMRERGSSNTFVFLDPPYDIKDFLYGKNREMHKSFDHNRFAEDVYNCVHKFMITYNVNDRLMELYKNYNLKEWKLRYSMAHRGDKGTDENIKTELLVTNYSIVPQTPLELALL